MTTVTNKPAAVPADAGLKQVGNLKVLVFDNYDSFTYNLVHALKELGVTNLDVVRNDKLDLDEAAVYDKIVLSPGPGVPSEAGLLLPLIHRYGPIKDILGVCLGHQALGEAFGATLVNLGDVHHGLSESVHTVAYDPLFAGLPASFEVGRYHSWIVAAEGLPDCFEVTSLDDEGQIMSMRHKTLRLHGVQFHPESVLTPDGLRILSNWLLLNDIR
ncbi:MAG: aminodeoxychorismate/anthranilate synthase component II [Bacteroidales bacterium]|nr:aminodeoxychorismate/anthranilate synthase component II [Bacteroidales bacterium]